MRLISKPNNFMRHLNSPAVLNSLEAKIVEAIPANARHVLVINAGDGRLARAAQTAAANATISVAGLHAALEETLDDFPQRTDEPWKLEWFEERVRAHGAFDCVIFYQLHEFWHGELHRLQRIVALAKPGAMIWASFLNAQAMRVFGRFLPPVRLGYWTLADPYRTAASVDFASYLDFATKIGGRVVELWGLLDSQAEAYCQKQPGQSVQWDLRGLKVTIGTFADAFLWGAAVVAVGFHKHGGGEAPAAPKISYSPYSANLLQALLLPYPDIQTAEGVLAAAEFEVQAWREKPAQELAPLARAFLAQVGNLETPKRVLVVGSGWGRDLLLLKRQYPAWDWTGFDHNAALVALGDGLRKEAGVEAQSGRLRALPYADKSFDLVLSLGYFSRLHEPAARALATELLRISKGEIYHLEDGRGPEHDMQLTAYPIKSLYAELGTEPKVQPVLVDGTPVGMFLVKVSPPS